MIKKKYYLRGDEAGRLAPRDKSKAAYLWALVIDDIMV